MKRHIIVTAALAALLYPGTVLAQQPPPDAPPPPQMRAHMEQLRSQAKTAAFNDLSADHRAKVQAILQKVQGGSLDPRAASEQIDALLTPAESQAVLAEMQKMHDAMKKALANAPHRTMRKPDAGHALLMLSMPRPPMPPPPPGQPH